MIQKGLPDLSAKSDKNSIAKRTNDRARHPGQETKGASRLIEFPGTMRPMPEWRKQLSQRVREVQERKAREAAEELAAAQQAGLVSCALPSGQLELVPDLEQTVMNPIVSKALERIDRARRVDDFASAGTAVATAPALDQNMVELSLPAGDDAEVPSSRPRLTVVTPEALIDHAVELSVEQTETNPAEGLAIESSAEAQSRKPGRVISDDDSALSYLETCLSLPALSSDTRDDLPGLTRRFFGGVIDLVVIALIISPGVAAVYFSGSKWNDPRVIEIMGSVAVVTMFAYLTISIALTGRTLAMRMLSLRTIDLRTGLIPTGAQSIKRAIGFVFSLAFLGLGLGYALIDPDHRTVYDRLSNTIVVRG
ncbi:MAG: RDD family protein [Pyrinomonadaceae bacterium]